MPEIIRVLVLSTSHLPKECAANFAELAEVHFVAVYTEGAFVWVPALGPADSFEDTLYLLRHHLGAQWDVLGPIFEMAQKHDCQLVRFDCDAEVLEPLPTWDW